jgi:Tfp pilus assembly protein PilO
MAASFDMRDPKTQRIIATVLVPVVLIYAFYNFMIKPKTEEVKTKKTELVVIQKRLMDIKKGLEDPKKLNTEKELLQGKYDELEKLLPSKENVANLLGQVTDVENNSKIYMVGFEASESSQVQDKSYSSNKYKITIESGFHQFAQFMSNIMTLPRIISFSEITIQNNTMADRSKKFQEGLEDQPRNLTIECVITTYVFKEISKDSGS